MDGAQSTATILLTCLARPSAYGVRVFCEKGSAEINFETQTLLINRQSVLIACRLLLVRMTPR